MSHDHVHPPVTVPPTRPDPLTTSTGHPIHPTQRSSTPQRATMDGPTTRTCRVCRCTSDDCTGCIQRTGRPCHWIADDLCSACVGLAIQDVTNEPTTVRPVTGLVARDDVPVEAEVVEEPWDEWLLGALQPRLDESDAAWVVEVVDAGVRSQLVVELERMEGDLAVAVHEATTARAELGRVRVAASVAFKGPQDTDASYLRAAAGRIEAGYGVGGSNVTAAVVRVLRAVAELVP